MNNTHRFFAADAASALAQIREQLGPDAIVLSVRPMRGWARLWSKKRRIEVVAALPDEGTLLSQARATAEGNAFSGAASTQWQSVAWLQAMGLLPVYADRLQAQLNSMFPSAPASLEDEWMAVSAALGSFWRTAPGFADAAPRPHVFIGAPGSGKTTVLCKWLTLGVLTEERSAHVWRLDGASANTAEFLSIHCEMLGAPVERFWCAPDGRADLLFVDVPGVEADDVQALAALRRQLAALPDPHVHLVLNAAYETSTLFAQWRAFAPLNPEDLIFTHLDEETRRVKLWNFVFGTNCSIRFLSAGQKVPGEFLTAAPEHLFPLGN